MRIERIAIAAIFVLSTGGYSISNAYLGSFPFDTTLYVGSLSGETLSIAIPRYNLNVYFWTQDIIAMCGAPSTGDFCNKINQDSLQGPLIASANACPPIPGYFQVSNDSNEYWVDTISPLFMTIDTVINNPIYISVTFDTISIRATKIIIRKQNMTKQILINNRNRPDVLLNGKKVQKSRAIKAEQNVPLIKANE